MPYIEGPSLRWIHATRSEEVRVSGLFVGLATLDVLQLVETLPAPDEKVRGLDDMLAAGGPATNAAVAFAHLGGAATLLTRAPDGPAWELMRADLAARRVDVHRVAAQRGRRTTVATILVTRATGERAVISTGDRTHLGDPPPLAEPIEIDVARHDVVLLDGHEPDLAAHVAARANAAGVPVVLDGGSWKATTPELLPLVDAAVVSSAFAPEGVDGTERVLDFLLDSGVGYAAVTAGAGGIRYRSRNQEGEVPAQKADVVDTLGAGDFFHGAFAHHVAGHGLGDESFRAALARGAQVAARSVESFGTRAWLGDGL